MQNLTSGHPESHDSPRSPRSPVKKKHRHGSHSKRHSSPTRSDSNGNKQLQQYSQNPNMGVVAVGAVVAYASLKGGIKAFHLTRRVFLRHLLLDLTSALNAVNSLTWWLDFGSCLGIYRDGDLIPHDNDIDLAVLNPNWKALEHHIRKHTNYSVALVVPSEDASCTFMRVYCNLAFADVFGAIPHIHKDDEHLLVDCGHGDCTSVPADLVLPVGQLNWRGAELKVPGKLEEHLEFRYGPTWKTPIYMDKGADEVEHNKMYAKVFRALARVGIRL